MFGDLLRLATIPVRILNIAPQVVDEVVFDGDEVTSFPLVRSRMSWKTSLTNSTDPI